MGLLSKFEGWSVKIFLEKLLRRAVPVASATIVHFLQTADPVAFAGLSADSTNAVFTAAVWAVVSLVQNLLKYQTEK